jgi:CxxC motif-containing protein (DUF1111 family)
MKGSYWVGYLLVGAVALTPVGLRVLTWPGAKHHAVEPALAQAGEVLFHHEWKPNDPLSASGDGLGPVFNASSCVACHHQAGSGGAGGLEHNVTTFVVEPVRVRNCNQIQIVGQRREGVIHSQATRYQETLQQVHTGLPAIAQPSLAMLVSLRGMESRKIQFPQGVHLSQRNTPALFGARLIDEIPDRLIIANERSEKLQSGLAPGKTEDIPVGRANRLADGRIGKFGWKAQTASLSDFVQAACANELGLGNPGQAQPRPLGNPNYLPSGIDLTTEQCNQITTYVASLPRPTERLPEDSLMRDQSLVGQKLFRSIGCADCHVPNIGSVEGIYSDLLLHNMGQTLEGGGSYNEPPPDLPGPSPDGSPDPGEWRTPPLWGVADSAPYLHDGRAATLEEAIKLHSGQGTRAASRFSSLGKREQDEVVAFLKTLQAP